ncbi:MAG TPA: N-acyl-D-amino-acid deacylase, partial [Microbacteriaceae bacterium]|nr:N-acyl-D-amino-acid deacylase [Microbacteriaceae bacterium]
LDVALFMAQVGHMGAPSDLKNLLHIVTYANAKIVGVDAGYGLNVGDRADLVVLDAPDGPTGMLDRAVRSVVIKGGKVVARTEKHTELLPA